MNRIYSVSNYKSLIEDYANDLFFNSLTDFIEYHWDTDEEKYPVFWDYSDFYDHLVHNEAESFCNKYKVYEIIEFSPNKNTFLSDIYDGYGNKEIDYVINMSAYYAVETDIREELERVFANYDWLQNYALTDDEGWVSIEKLSNGVKNA